MPLREIQLTLPNRPGALAQVARVLARDRINLAAIGVDSTPARGRVRLIVGDPDRATALLEQAGYTVETREMIVVRLEDRAGSFLRVLDALARARINIQSVAILLAREGNRVLVALSTNDMARTRQVLQGTGLLSRSAERFVTNADLVAQAPTIPSESVGFLL